MKLSKKFFRGPCVFFLLYLPCLSIYGSDFNSNTTMKEIGKKKYAALLNSFDSFDQAEHMFWQIGKALDTLVEFGKANNLNLEELGQKAVAFYDKKTANGKVWWWDDYGWWGFAFMRLYEETKNQDYLTKAVTCWNNMLPAQKAYKNSTIQYKENQEPLFDNGCYNSPLVAEGRNDGFKGIQNTVTNAVFLRLSLSLFDHHRNNADLSKHFWDAALAQYQWFIQWFEQGLLNKMYAASGSLVEERVNKYKNQQPSYRYMENRFWIGDQALMIENILDMASSSSIIAASNPRNLDIRGIDANSLYNQATHIAKAVQEKMVQNSGFIVYLTNWGDEFPFGDAADYYVGPGAFLQSLIHGSKLYKDFKPFVTTNFQEVMSQYALAACRSSLAINSIDSFNAVANELAAINAVFFFDINIQSSTAQQ